MLCFLIPLLCFIPFPVLADACCQEALKKEGDTLTSPAARYPQLLVFVSFSMPMTSLKILGDQVNRVGGSLIFRGLVEGSFKETIEKFRELGQPALIDPTLFEVYKVVAVPTFVLRHKATDEAEVRVTHDCLNGYVSLFHALEQFERQGDTSSLAHMFLQKLRKSR